MDLSLPSHNRSLPELLEELSKSASGWRQSGVACSLSQQWVVSTAYVMVRLVSGHLCGAGPGVTRHGLAKYWAGPHGKTAPG
jgi:hypothetical protein